jgi:hypothetical protein
MVGPSLLLLMGHVTTSAQAPAHSRPPHHQHIQDTPSWAHARACNQPASPANALPSQACSTLRRWHITTTYEDSEGLWYKNIATATMHMMHHAS